MEAGKSEGQAHPQLLTEFEGSLTYVRLKCVSRVHTGAYIGKHYDAHFLC